MPSAGPSGPVPDGRMVSARRPGARAGRPLL